MKTNLIAAVTVLVCGGMAAQPTYCSSSSQFTGDEDIYNVMLNGSVTDPLYSFNNNCTTPAPGPGSALHLYSNFKTLGALTTITVGVPTTYSVQEDECNGATYYAFGSAMWIDFNGDGDFTDPGENIYTEANTLAGPRGINGTFVVPSSAVTGSTVMRVIVAEGYSGSGLTPCLTYGYGETEDYRIDIVPAPPCTGVPAANAITGPTSAICPNTTADLGIVNNYPFSNITYQWMYSTTGGSVGIYAPVVPTGTNYSYTTPALTQDTWYQLVIGCGPTTGPTTMVTQPFLVSVAPITTVSVPYHEGFEGIPANDLLPNCSWSATSVGGSTRTYTIAQTQNRVARTGSKFAAFTYTPAGTNYFYSNEVWLNASVTYSANIWFMTESYGYPTWSDLSILVGPNQSTTGLVPIASTNGPAISGAYKPLGSTFTVATSGLYNIAIKATSTGACCGYHLSWDDLTVTVPCELNTVPLVLNTGSVTICEGESLNLIASGALGYAWSNGAQTSSLVVTPNNDAIFTVTGTNTLSGCSAVKSASVVVKESPDVFIFANNTKICPGESVVLSAQGATSYTWTTTEVEQQITVSPSLTSTYVVMGTNGEGCTGTATQVVTVKSAPNVQASASPTMICVGESATVTAEGGNSFQWVVYPSNQVFNGKELYVSPSASTMYSVTVVNSENCTGTSFVSVVVDECTSLSENGKGIISVFPNPAHDAVNIFFGTGGNRLVEVSDLSGRILQRVNTSETNLEMDLRELNAGVYNITVKGDSGARAFKLIKE